MARLRWAAVSGVLATVPVRDNHNTAVEGMNEPNLRFRGLGIHRGFLKFLKEDGRR